jgi:hypothetical protein
MRANEAAALAHAPRATPYIEPQRDHAHPDPRQEPTYDSLDTL